MNPWVFWGAPPLIGAIIGYLTNAVAIKMLFKPHREIRIFGLRLPFTPGVLPRQRGRLADSIGLMVEQKLLTPEILRERLFREDVRRNANAAVVAYTKGALETPLSTLEKSAGALLNRYLHSPDFTILLDTLLDCLLESLEASSERFMNSSVREILGEARTLALKTSLEEFLASNEKKIPLLGPALYQAFPHIADTLIAFLRKKEIHEQLEIQGRIFLDNAIQKLSTMQRFFITAGQYDKTLMENAPEIIDDLIRQLEILLSDPDIRKRLVTYALDKAAEGGWANVLTNFLITYTDIPLGTLLEKFNFRKSEDVKALIKLLAPNHGAEEVERGVIAFFAKHGSQSIGEFLKIGDETKERLDQFITERILFMADTKLEELLGTINIRTLVSDRIDSLEMIEVERIVLDVMANQFKWINIFGAILGGLIGGFQSLFIYLAG